MEARLAEQGETGDAKVRVQQVRQVARRLAEPTDRCVLGFPQEGAQSVRVHELEPVQHLGGGRQGSTDARDARTAPGQPPPAPRSVQKTDQGAHRDGSACPERIACIDGLIGSALEARHLSAQEPLRSAAFEAGEPGGLGRGQAIAHESRSGRAGREGNQTQTCRVASTSRRPLGIAPINVSAARPQKVVPPGGPRPCTGTQGQASVSAGLDRGASGAPEPSRAAHAQCDSRPGSCAIPKS